VIGMGEHELSNCLINEYSRHDWRLGENTNHQIS
jgi:hypothetical protein